MRAVLTTGLLVLAAVAALAVVVALPPVRRSRERYLPVNQKALLGRWVSDEVEVEFSARRWGGSFRSPGVKELAPRGGGVAYVDYVNRRKASRPGVSPVINSSPNYDFPDARTVRLTVPLGKMAVGHLGSDGRLRLTLVLKDFPLSPKGETPQHRVIGLPWPPGTTFTLSRAKEGAGRGGPVPPAAGRARPPGRGEQTAPQGP
jgi:hypothetical protein